MHAFNIQLVDYNHALVLELINHLFCILHNSPTVVGITHSIHSFRLLIYIQSVVIYMHIYTKDLCGVGGRFKRV